MSNSQILSEELSRIESHSSGGKRGALARMYSGAERVAEHLRVPVMEVFEFVDGEIAKLVAAEGRWVTVSESEDNGAGWWTYPTVRDERGHVIQVMWDAETSDPDNRKVFPSHRREYNERLVGRTFGAARKIVHSNVDHARKKAEQNREDRKNWRMQNPRIPTGRSR